jgi:hypothetical protein
MKLRKLSIAISMVGVSALGVVGCGGSSNSYPQIITVSGTAIDPYLQNAIVCLDTNGDKSCDGEPSATRTDLNGEFSFEASDTGAPIVVEVVPGETTDSSTKGVAGAVVTEALTLAAPVGSSVVTPFTTLVQRAIERGQTAESVATRLGLAGTDLSSYDFVSSGEVEVLAIAAATANAIRGLAEAASDAGADDETALEAALDILLGDGDSQSSTSIDDIVADPDVVVSIDPSEVADAVEDAAEINVGEGDTTPTGATAASGAGGL